MMMSLEDQRDENDLSYKQARSYKQLQEDNGYGGDQDQIEKTYRVDQIEKTYGGAEMPPWKSQLTVRAFVVSCMLGTLCSALVMKLSLTTLLVAPVGMYAGLLGFSLTRTFTIFLHKCGIVSQPFTRQENTVIQTCVVAITSIAQTGGLSSYIFAMSEITAKRVPIGNNPEEIKNPRLGWIIACLLLTSFLSLFSMLPFRKAMLLDRKMVFPEGTASGNLLNFLHAPLKSKFIKKRVITLGKFFAFSFFWNAFMWFYASDRFCGFRNFPTFGLKAFSKKFNFSFSTSQIGMGMISPYITPISVLIGAVLSWGIMWPYLITKKGDWYSADLPMSSHHSLAGYKVFLFLALVVGDGLYHVCKILLANLSHQDAPNNDLGSLTADRPSAENTNHSYNEDVRRETMLKDHIPSKVAMSGYVALVAVSMAGLPQIFPQIKWYYLLVIYIIAPVMGFCKAYGGGLSDLQVASPYGKIPMFLVAPWAGAAHNGVFVGLAAHGFITNFAAIASDLMLNFRIGYLTLASPKSLFVSHVIGTAMGCVISPFIFWYFYKAHPDIGTSSSKFPVYSATTIRNLSSQAIDGFSALPKNCLLLCYVFFSAAILANILRDTLPKRWARFIPIPTAVATTFNTTANCAIDMCVGSLILFVWKLHDKAGAAQFAPIVATGLLYGDGVWTLPDSILDLIGWEAPMCMRVMSRETYRSLSIPPDSS